MAQVYWACFRYSKAEVLLLDLRQPNEITRGLYAAA
ncbi:DNA-directed DNA polymerase [Pseudomonas sp. VLB120]|nr:DNA-directed DNA polymerase [Pseudomonas sp. VLB120]